MANISITERAQALLKNANENSKCNQGNITGSLR